MRQRRIGSPAPWAVWPVAGSPQSAVPALPALRRAVNWALRFAAPTAGVSASASAASSASAAVRAAFRLSNWVRRLCACAAASRAASRFGLLARRCPAHHRPAGALRPALPAQSGHQLRSVYRRGIQLQRSRRQCGFCGGELCLPGGQLLRQPAALCGGAAAAVPCPAGSYGSAGRCRLLPALPPARAVRPSARQAPFPVQFGRTGRAAPSASGSSG